MKKLTTLFLWILMPACLFSQTWTQQTSPVTTDLNSACAVDYNTCWICGPAGVVVKTTNGGSTWTSVGGGALTGSDLYTIFAFDGTNAWVGAGDGGLFKTTNGGSTWTFVSLTPSAPFINVVHFWNANQGFVMGDPFASQWSYYITSNGGLNWVRPPNTPASSGSEAGWNNSYATIDTGRIWWGTNVSKIWKGGFLGPFASSPTSGSVNSYGVAFINANTGVVCFSTGAVRRSTDGGATWPAGSFTPSGTPYGLKALYTGPYLYIWMSTATTIYRSTDGGLTFTSQFTLPANRQGFCISMSSANRGWVGTQMGGIYVYNDPVGINNNENHTPTKFVLKQNFPNPFNPSTTIYFDLPAAGHITLKLYDVLGNEIKSLIDGVMPAGEHHTFFIADGLPSGVYFYKMVSGQFSDTKKMIITK